MLYKHSLYSFARVMQNSRIFTNQCKFILCPFPVLPNSRQYSCNCRALTLGPSALRYRLMRGKKDFFKGVPLDLFKKIQNLVSI